MSVRFKEDKNKDKEIADDEIVKMTEYVESKKLKIVNTSNTKNRIKNYKRLNKEEYYDKAEKKVKKYIQYVRKKIIKIRYLNVKKRERRSWKVLFKI